MAVLGWLLVAVLEPRVKSISIRSIVQHLSISIGVAMSEVILVSIANIMSSSNRGATSTELVFVAMFRSSISLSLGMGIHGRSTASVGRGTRRISKVIVRLGYQPLRPRVKRISSRSVIQHLTISIWVAMPEVIFVSISNIVAGSSRGATSTEVVVITMGISLRVVIARVIIDLIGVDMSLVAISLNWSTISLSRVVDLTAVSLCVSISLMAI